MRYIDLFCGIGGFRYGLEKVNQGSQYASEVEQDWKGRDGSSVETGRDNLFPGRSGAGGGSFECIWSNDIDKYACSIYRYRYGEIHEGDIRAVDPAAIPDADLICGGFPCQSFSIAGKRRGFEDTRGTLFFEICRIARAKRVKYLFLENVKGLLNHSGGATFETIIRTLDELGYDCEWIVLNSKNFGVPQNRERVFIIGHIRGERRPQIFPVGENDERNNEGQPEATNVGSLTGGGHSGGHHSGMTIIREQLDISGKGYNSQQDRIYHEEGIMACLPNAHPDNKLNIFHKNTIRRLTPIEAERLQGFPDNWTSKGIDRNGKEVLISDSQRYKCLGNAVTTNVITEIGLKLRKLTGGDTR